MVHSRDRYVMTQPQCFPPCASRVQVSLRLTGVAPTDLSHRRHLGTGLARACPPRIGPRAYWETSVARQARGRLACACNHQFAAAILGMSVSDRGTLIGLTQFGFRPSVAPVSC